MGDIHGIPDEVLELILVLLASPAHLIPAASTCRRWYGIIADARFLSRFNSLNARHLIAGSYHNGRQGSTFVASSSSSPPVVHGGRFSLDFLWSGDKPVVDPKSWKIVDSRGGLLLWAKEDLHDMVVCEPLTQRYKVIPPPMVTSISHCLHSGPFLLDGERAAGGGIDLSNFRVIVLCEVFYDHRYYLRASMFTSGSWDGYYAMDGDKMRHFMGRTRAFLYWHVGVRTVMALDRSTAELLSSELPAAYLDDTYGLMKVAAGRDDGEPRVLDIAAGGVLRVFAALPGGVRDEWTLQKTIQLSPVVAGLKGYLPPSFSGELHAALIDVTDPALVTVAVALRLLGRWESWAFRLDVETLEAELVVGDATRDVAFPFELPWPPVLHARPRIAGV